MLSTMKKILSIFAAVLFVGSMFAAEVTVTKTVHDLFPDDENGTKELTLFNEDGLSISVNDKGNNGKIYDTGKEWRIYRSSDAVVTVALTSGVIKSIAFTFKYANAGTLLHGTNVMTSGTAIAINAASATFTVGNSDENTNGQIKITGFTVVYDKGTTPDPDVCEIVSKGDLTILKYAKVFTDEFESNGSVGIGIATHAEVFAGTEIAGDLIAAFQFVPKQKEGKADLRGAYSIGDEAVKAVVIRSIGPGGEETIWNAKTGGSFKVMLNEAENAYNLVINATYVNDETSTETSVTDTIFNICSKDLDPAPYCHVGSTADFGWKAAAPIIEGTEGALLLPFLTNPNWLVDGALGDGADMFIIITPENRKDLRGQYTIAEGGAIIYTVDGGASHTYPSVEGSEVTITLDANKTTYDLSYRLTLKVSETETQVTEGTIYRFCDDKMDIPAGIEDVSAANVNGNKIIRNGHLFIEHEGHLYNANGIQVK